MILDFSKCKTIKDVDEIFNKNLKETKTLFDVSELIRKCLEANNEIRNKKNEEKVKHKQK